MTPRPADRNSPGRRLIALRVLLGYGNRRDFAQDYPIDGLGEKTLAAIEQGNRDLHRRDQLALAEATGVPAEFLEGQPLERLRTSESAEALQRIEARLAHIEALLEAGEPSAQDVKRAFNVASSDGAPEFRPPRQQSRQSARGRRGSPNRKRGSDPQ